MVVENQEQNIRSSLESVAPFIDYWVIIDRGSSDQTRALIEETLAPIPGELLTFTEGSLTDALNFSLERAKTKSDAILAWAAIDTWIGSGPPSLDADACILKVKSDRGVSYEIRLINPRLEWKWMGIAFPELFSPEATHYTMPLPVCIEKKPQTTTITSSCFYTLGRAYKECNLLEAAHHYLSSYVRLFPQSKNYFEALYLLATTKEQLDFPLEEIVNSYRKAAENNPYPHDSLYRLASFLRKNGRYTEALEIASLALDYPPIPHQLSFIPWSNRWCSHAGLVLEYTLSSFYLKRPSANAGAFSLVKIQNADPLIVSIGEGILRSHALENFKP
jgi:tetratricopeptide (TPR) repeat protein